jgi:hypothetical protein
MSTPGMMYPTSKAMLAGNPRDAAIAQLNGSNQRQLAANASMAAGGKMKRKHRGGAAAANGTIAVPIMRTLYTPQGGPGTNPSDQMVGNTKTSTQMAANQVYDNQATITGGSKRRKGGNPNWLWGCMSGGKKKKKTRKNTKRSRKNKQTRRRRY